MLVRGTDIYWEKATHNVDLKGLFPLKLNIWITINGTKDPTWFWSKYFKKLYFFSQFFGKAQPFCNGIYIYKAFDGRIPEVHGFVVNLDVLKQSSLGKIQEFYLPHGSNQQHQCNAAHLLSPSKRKGV